MFKSLVEFVNYSDFASRVRKLEKESKTNSKSFPDEELQKFLRNEFASSTLFPTVKIK